MKPAVRILPTIAILAALSTAATAASVTVDRRSPTVAVTDQILGMNMANWFDPTQADMAAALKTGGIAALRWPGGSASDVFHWQGNSECNGGYVDGNATFDKFFSSIVAPLGADVAVTVDYGSNAACTGGGDPAEAAAWAAYALAHGDNVSHWTVGNEEYGTWEYDLHATPHDATTYAGAVASGYYPKIKAANPAALVGVVVQPGWTPAWDPIVLSQAPYDFVEFHYYAQGPGSESDSYLVGAASQDFATQIAAVKADLAAAGHAGTPIYVGELGSVYSNPGKQTTSITQALFAGQVLGEMMNAGVSRATWWLGYGGCSDASGGNFSASLYGWQTFGGYMVFSDGTPEYGCGNAPVTPLGTPLPTARAFQLFSTVARDGEQVLPLTSTGAASIRAYAATHGAGTAVVLFNLSEVKTLPVRLIVKGMKSASDVSVSTYDKATYDRSKNGVWAGPVTKDYGAMALPTTLSLTPWSMNVVIVTP
jgi:hypothetical protein